MKKNNNILLGILTLSIPVYIVFFIIFTFYLVFNVPAELWMNYLFPYVIVPHLCMSIISIFVFIVVMFHIIRNKRLTNVTKVLWIIVCLGTMALAIPIYWLVHIRTDQRLSIKNLL